MTRYIVTERLVANVPSQDDPKAAAFKMRSGVFDIRDSYSDNVICASTCKLSSARAAQAKWNSKELILN